MGTLEKSVRGFAERTGSEVVKPELATTVDSLTEAYDFYNLYSWEHGFGVRYGKSRLNQDKRKTMQGSHHLEGAEAMELCVATTTMRTELFPIWWCIHFTGCFYVPAIHYLNASLGVLCRPESFLGLGTTSSPINAEEKGFIVTTICCQDMLDKLQVAAATTHHRHLHGASAMAASTQGCGSDDGIDTRLRQR